MMYLHDVWVNWFEGEENSYNICPYYEWRKADTIELLDQIPLLYLETSLYKYVEDNLADIPKKLLEMIKDCTFMKNGQEKIPLTHASIITDGIEVLAFDTLGYTVPIRKSRIIPRQERKVLQLIKGKQPCSIPWEKNYGEKEYHLLSLPPEVMRGLTRTERQLKQLLMMSLDTLKQSKNTNEVQYWLTEWMPDQYEHIRELSFSCAWRQLYQGIYLGWSLKHEMFCKEMIKGQPFFEQMWDLANEKDPTYLAKRIL